MATKKNLKKEEYEVLKLQIESSGRVRKLLQWHLGLELARYCRCPQRWKILRGELTEAVLLRNCNMENFYVTLEELIGEIEETARKMDANLKSRVERHGRNSKGTSSWKRKGQRKGRTPKSLLK